MSEQHRDSTVLAVVEHTMPDGTDDEKLEATRELWEFFDAVWAIAHRLVTEQGPNEQTRDKSRPSATVNSSQQP